MFFFYKKEPQRAILLLKGGRENGPRSIDENTEKKNQRG